MPVSPSPTSIDHRLALTWVRSSPNQRTSRQIVSGIPYISAYNAMMNAWTNPAPAHSRQVLGAR